MNRAIGIGILLVFVVVLFGCLQGPSGQAVDPGPPVIQLESFPNLLKIKIATASLPSGIFQYNVYRADYSGGYSTSIGCINADDSQPMPGCSTDLAFHDTSAQQHNLYYYVVRAKNALGESGNSNEVFGASVDTPINLVASSTIPVSLSWTEAPVNSGPWVRDGYEVYRWIGTAGGFYANTGTKSFQDSSVTAGTTYTYAVLARYSNGGVSIQSGITNLANVTPAASVLTPSCSVPSPTAALNTLSGGSVSGTVNYSNFSQQPSSLTATCGNGASITGFSCTIPSNNSGSCSFTCGPYDLAAAISNIVVGSTSCSGGYGVSVSPGPPATALSISDISVTPSHNSASISWNTSSTANSFVQYDTILDLTSPYSYANNGTQSGTYSTSFSASLSSLSPTTTYYYRVFACNGTTETLSSCQSNYSQWDAISNEQSFSTSAVPLALNFSCPSSSTISSAIATKTYAPSITVSNTGSDEWRTDQNFGMVFNALDSNVVFQKISSNTSSGSNASFDVNFAAPSGTSYPLTKTFKFQMKKGTNSFGTECSYPVSVSTPYPAPSGVSASGGDGIVDVSWNVIGANDRGNVLVSGYYIYRSTTSGKANDVNGTKLNSTILANSTSYYRDSSATNETPYYYAVQAVYADGTKALSGEDFAQPSANIVNYDYATCVSPYNVPANMTAGQSYSFALTLQNSGTNTWNSSNYKLRVSGIASSTIGLDAGDSIDSVSQKTFNISLNVPSTASTGSQPLYWQMYKGTQSFGVKCQTTVSIHAGADSANACSNDFDCENASDRCSAGACIPISCPNGTIISHQCVATPQGTSCDVNSDCTSGEYCSANTCEPLNCPNGTIKNHACVRETSGGFSLFNPWLVAIVVIIGVALILVIYYVDKRRKEKGKENGEGSSEKEKDKPFNPSKDSNKRLQKTPENSDKESETESEMDEISKALKDSLEDKPSGYK